MNTSLDGNSSTSLVGRPFSSTSIHKIALLSKILYDNYFMNYNSNTFRKTKDVTKPNKK